MEKKLTEAVNWFREERAKEENESEQEDEEKKEFERVANSWKKWRIGRNRANRDRKKMNARKRKERSNEEKSNLEKDDKCKTVIFIQHTPHSELAQKIRKRLSELEKVGKVKIKLVERAGTKLVDLLHKSNPWSKQDCDRKECNPCKLAGELVPKGQCYNRNIVYETFCELCGELNEEKKDESENIKRKMKEYKWKYIGETNRSFFERTHEHFDDLERLYDRSHMLRHYVLEHPEMKLE